MRFRTRCLLGSRPRPQAGYSLIDMALAMVVIGMILSGMGLAFKIYIKNNHIATTKDNAEAVNRAVSNFILENGRFPCPAAIDLPPDDENYGREANCADFKGYLPGAGESAVVPVGGFDGGIWVERGAASASERVVRGMVPFHALNIPEYYTLDGYQSRLVYAVTAAQTDADTFMRDGGQISVIDSLATETPVNKSNHFIVYSHGPDRKGAYSRYGREIFPCGEGLDKENCDMSGTAVYRAARYSTATGTESYDDVMINNVTMELPLWRLDDDNFFNMHDIKNKRVMIGDILPSASPAEVKVDVGGVMRSTNTYSREFCLNDDPNKCFETELIAGFRPEMDCDSSYARSQTGAFMRSIGDSHARCGDELSFSCPTDHYVSGMNPDGSRQCTHYIFTPPEPDAEPAAATNGSCGSANGSTTATAPTSGLCSSGTATAVEGTGPWTWTCMGDNGGGSSGTCTANTGPVCDPAYKPSTCDLATDGACGAATTTPHPTAPTANLCATGTPTAVSGSGPWTWTCNGQGGGTNSGTCSADKILDVESEHCPTMAKPHPHCQPCGAGWCCGSDGDYQCEDTGETEEYCRQEKTDCGPGGPIKYTWIKCPQGTRCTPAGSYNDDCVTGPGGSVSWHSITNYECR